MDQFLYIVVGICIPLALLLCGVLGWEVRRTLAVTNLYREPVRDLRFVCALLRYYLPGGKWRILRNPCLLTDDRSAPARADLLVIGGGGVLILTVDDRAGHFSTPPTGDWTLWQGGKGKKVENRFTAGRQYTSVINSILVRNGISCSVVNLVVLSDDFAAADDLYAERILTCNQLIPYAQRFCKGKLLSRSEQKQIREAIAAHHSRCRRALAEAEAKSEAAHRAEEKPLSAEDLFAVSAPSKAASRSKEKPLSADELFADSAPTKAAPVSVDRLIEEMIESAMPSSDGQTDAQDAGEAEAQDHAVSAESEQE